ncbi:hypothetical protein HBA55_04630 [Pseudomaricurvus alkylphenolicus]|jgi:hypothetical protein|uniref:hypothetical protein n=1 Tax=Pseudomaricurvus alkylphenolicus TaxID=1306991 RepID=UPI0014220294|nr:hypothetical protein [Pseudomaricurvus alkylphenolicus]NIB38858.1 hypothetical protein [Pseudomaricurvus alkylphenolicus]
MSEVISIYDVTTTLANIDANKARLFVFGGLALICNFIYFGAGIYQGFKHKVFSMPVCATLIFIPHDLLYLMMFDKWFNVYDHWFCQLFWVGLIITNLEEFLFLYLTLKYGRKELMPQVSQRTFQTLVLLGLAGVFVAWYAIKSVLADELWLFTFGWTVWFCIPFVIPMMLRRNSAVGNSTLMWGAYIGMALCYWAAVWPLAPFFRSPAWLALGALVVVWALAVIVVMKKLQSGSPVKDLGAVAAAS